MTNTIQNAGSAESIDAYINDPDALTPAVYRIIEWKMPEDDFCGSVTLTGSRSFIDLEVLQTLTFEGLKDRHFRRISVDHIHTSHKIVTLEATDQNTFKLSADECVFFEGNAIEVNTRSGPSGFLC